MEDDDIAVKKQPLSDFHLRNPLKDVSWMVATKVPKRQKMDKSYVNNNFKSCAIGTPIDLIIRDDLKVIPQAIDNYEDAIRDLNFRLSVDLKTFCPELHPDSEAVIAASSNVRLTVWNLMRTYGKILTIMNAISSGRDPPSGFGLNKGDVVLISFDSGSQCIHVLQNCMVIEETKSRKGTLYDGDWIRMASDVWTERFLIGVCVQLGPSINPHQYPDQSVIDHVIEWGDNVLKDLGNEGYKVLKTFEAIVIGVVQERGESSIIDPGRFLKNTLEDLLSENTRYHAHAIRLTAILDTITNLHWLIQIYGIHRIWGHPIVDSPKGMEKVIKIGQKDIMEDMSLADDTGRMFKLSYCREYKRKHGLYPTILEGTTKLHADIIDQDDRACDTRVHPLMKWDRIKFGKIHQLPETFNLSMIIADKAISPTKSELIRSIKTIGTVVDSDKRRGVKRWLNDDTLKPKEFLTLVNDGHFPDDHKVIGLTPKERELGCTPRMFALMSHLMRVYVVVTEQMLSEHILKYFPQITMTDSLLDLTKKVYTTVKDQSSQSRNQGKRGAWASRTICMSLDFEKWNGHMRKEMTLGVFTSLGDIFGLPELYNNTYDLFSDSYIYLADGSYVPKVKNGMMELEYPYSFTGHKGGMEGLRQKGWTIFTVCALMVVLSRYNCSFKIMGMGDNQVLQITLYTNKVDDRGRPTDQGLNEIKANLNKIFANLIDSFTSMGLPLKPLETWISEDLYLYGKWPLWKGVPLAMDLKKLMRTFSMSNADVMTLENALGTVSGGVASATQSSSCIWMSYMIGVIMSSLCISDFLDYHPLLGRGMIYLAGGTVRWTLAMGPTDRTHFSIKENQLKRRDIRRLIQLIPRTLGGYNGININELMMRGFPDNLSRDVSYLFGIIPLLTGNLKTAVINWCQPIFMREKNYSTLLQDVTGVNLVSPRSPTSGIRQTVTKYMTDGIKISNQEFNSLMRSRDKMLSDYLCQCLCEGSVLHIRLLHDIYEASIFGYVDSILSKVTKTSTIQKLAIGSSVKDVFNTIERDEENYFKFFVWRSHTEGDDISLDCATEWCKQVRFKGWGKELRGVTTPFPRSFISMTKCTWAKGCNCDDGYLSAHLPDGQMSNESWMMDIGGNPPYLGSKTKEKVIIGSGNKIYSSEPLVRRPINLLKTINWFVPPDSLMADLICETVSSVTDMNPEPFKGVLEGTAGSEVHRYRDSSTSHGALTSSNFLFSTRIHLSTDNLTRYSKGADNTDIHYQALFCMMTEMVNMYVTNRIRTGSLMERFIHFKQTCYSCISPIPEDFIDIPTRKAIRAIPARKGNEYLFVSEDKIRMLERISPLVALSTESISMEGYMMMTPKEKRILLQDYVVDRISRDISDQTSEESFVSSGLLDVKSFERTMYLKLDPKYIYDRTISRLSLLGEMRYIKEKGKTPSKERDEVKRIVVNMINGCAVSKFLGLAMFYCWEETSNVSSLYPYFTDPDSNPISIGSSCAAAKRNLLSLLDSKGCHPVSRTPIILEDEKQDYRIPSMFLYESCMSTRCVSCKVRSACIGKNEMSSLKSVICDRGHRIFDRTNNTLWKSSQITVERLRKDCDKFQRVEDEDLNDNKKITFMRAPELVKILSPRSYRERPTVNGVQTNPVHSPEFSHDYYSASGYNLMSKCKKPTSTLYKYVEIFSAYRDELRERDAFLIGDGLGTTSKILADLFGCNVLTSTILEPDQAIPQSYVHNTTPIRGTRVDHTTKINMPNNVCDPNWVSAWGKMMKPSISSVISDIEMINPDDSIKRSQAIRHVLCLKPWDICILKDYLYTAAELCNRLRVIIGRCTSWQLITTKFRSAHYPEVWWVCKNTTPNTIDGMAYDVRNSTPQWSLYMEAMTDDYFGDNVLEKISDIEICIPSSARLKMMSYLREWLTYPVVGSLFPEGGDYSKIFYYLKKTKKPSYAKTHRDTKHLKMFSADYISLKDRLFGLAASMIADLDMRIRFVNESENWTLDWEEKSGEDWRCILYKHHDGNDALCCVDDYIPMLSCFMKQRGLLFKSVPDTIRFRPDKKRKSLCFPISKTAHQSGK